MEEVLLESIGVRRQGHTAEMGLRWSETRDSFDTAPHRIKTRRQVTLLGTWARNTSLKSQVSLNGAGDYDWAEPAATAAIGGGYAYNLNDRNRLDASLQLIGRYEDGPEDGSTRRSLEGVLSATDEVFVEDRFAMRPSASLSYLVANNEQPNTSHPILSWDYRLTFTYYFNRGLY